ncbi:MAG TPA: hemolysin family protein [Thermodesulfobacteriota bacterium]
MDTVWRLAAVVVLVGANAFFVATEFALVGVRRTRIEELARAGHRRAADVKRALEHLDDFISATQLGITLASLALGWIGEPAVAHLIEPALAWLPLGLGTAAAHSAAIALAFVTITFLHVVLGELAPKSVALTHAEPTALWVARPTAWFLRLFEPAIRALNGSARLVLRVFGLRQAAEHIAAVSEEELKMLITAAAEKGLLDRRERELLTSVFEFSDTPVREVMTPAHKIKAVAVDAAPAEVLHAVVESGFSRLPVYERTLDQVLGYVDDRDLLGALVRKEPIDLRALVRPVAFVPETKKVGQLLQELRRRRMRMAVVLDEFGSTRGLATVEDLIEEIVGEIRDEREVDERPVERQPDGSLVVDASLSARDLREQYGVPIPESTEFETVAGFMLAMLQRIPKGGEIVTHEGYKFTVVNLDGRRIAKVKVEPAAGRVRVTA